MNSVYYVHKLLTTQLHWHQLCCCATGHTWHAWMGTKITWLFENGSVLSLLCKKLFVSTMMFVTENSWLLFLSVLRLVSQGHRAFEALLTVLASPRNRCAVRQTARTRQSKLNKEKRHCRYDCSHLCFGKLKKQNT